MKLENPFKPIKTKQKKPQPICDVTGCKRRDTKSMVYASLALERLYPLAKNLNIIEGDFDDIVPDPFFKVAVRTYMCPKHIKLMNQYMILAKKYKKAKLEETKKKIGLQLNSLQKRMLPEKIRGFVQNVVAAVIRREFMDKPYALMISGYGDVLYLAKYGFGISVKKYHLNCCSYYYTIS